MGMWLFIHVGIKVNGIPYAHYVIQTLTVYVVVYLTNYDLNLQNSLKMVQLRIKEY